MKESIKKRIEAVRRGEVPEGYVSKNHQLRPVDWKYEKIGKYLVPYDEFSNNIEAYPLATSSRQGLMLQSEYYNDQRYEETTGGFHVVPVGYVTYRHMSDDDIFRFNVNKMGQPVLVSPEYPVFTMTGGLNQDMFVAYLNGMKEFQAFCSAQKKGSTRTRMYFHRLGEFTIPIPSITEQQKIAEILETCDRIIELKQSKIDELNKLKQICLLEMFPQKGQTTPKRRFPGFSAPWEQRKFDEVFDCSIPNNTLSRAELSYDEGTVLNVHYGDVLIKYGSVLDVQEDDIPRIPHRCREEFNGALLQSGDVIIADTAEDETTGKACEIGNLQGGTIVSGLHTIVCRPRHRMASGYLGYYLNSNAYHHQLLPLMQGIKVLSLSRSNIQKTSVSYPGDVKEQQLISSYFSQLDRLITLHQRELAEVGKYKKALMQLLLTGLLRVNA